MNIVANGPGIYFSKYLGLKLQSPIDNMQCYNFKSILKILMEFYYSYKKLKDDQ